jgi:type I site-specific restriction endonuclease
VSLFSTFEKNQNLDPLNFPAYKFRLRPGEIFDPARKKFVALNPEEWVRQHAIRFLTEERAYPLSLMAVEVQLQVNKLKKRVDILVYGKNSKPLLIVECKAPSVRISQETFDQAARYNLALGADYFFITNGLTHFFCRSDRATSSYHFLKDLPAYGTDFPV